MDTHGDRDRYDDYDEDYEAANNLTVFVASAVLFLVGTYESMGGKATEFFEDPWVNTYTAAVEGLTNVVLFGDPAIAVPLWLVIIIDLVIIKALLKV